jgi:hypothetical protein
MIDAAINTATGCSSISIETDDNESNNNGYLYLLDLDCPFAWPVEPNYPISRPQVKKGMMNGAMNVNGGSHMDVLDSTVEDRPVASTSRLTLDASLLPGEQADGIPQDMQLDQSTAANGHDHTDAWPECLQEYYWDCLYCSEGSAKVSLSTYPDQHAQSRLYLTISISRLLLFSTMRCICTPHNSIMKLPDAS